MIKEGNNKVTEEDGTEIKSDAEATNNQKDVDISDWQTYRNEEYGFEFKYPKEWIINTKEQQTSRGKILMSTSNSFGKENDINRANFSIAVLNGTEKNLDEWVNEYTSRPPGYKIISKKEIKIDNINGETYDLEGPLFDTKMTVFKKNEILFSFVGIITIKPEFMDKAEKSKENINGIIKSFSFYN